MKDTTNSENIKMFLASIFIFFACIIIVMVMGILFGMQQKDTISHSYDRPVASMEYHDHRIDFSDNWVCNTNGQCSGLLIH